MCLLSIVGLIAAAWVGINVNPFLGIVVGFLFIGGLRWNILGSAFGAMLSPKTAKQAYSDDGKTFVEAWEQRFGRILPGSDTTRHLPGMA